MLEPRKERVEIELACTIFMLKPRKERLERELACTIFMKKYAFTPTIAFCFFFDCKVNSHAHLNFGVQLLSHAS